MGKKTLVFLTLMVLCAGASLSPDLLKEVGAVSGFPVHNISTGLNYGTIQSAINAIQTEDGNQIRVDAGTYNETLTVSKSVSVIGANPSTTTINGQITLSFKGAEIANFTLNGGVKVTSSYCTISSSIIVALSTGSDSGVVSIHVDNGFIQHNEIEGFSYSGIDIQYGNGWTILGNDIDNNRGGIVLEYSDSCIIIENSIHNDWVSYPPRIVP